MANAKEIAIKIKIQGEEIKVTGNSVKLFTDNIKKLKDELEKLGQRTEENGAAFDALKEDLDSLQTAFEQTTTEVVDNTASLSSNETQTESTTVATKSYASQIRVLRTELASLGDRTNENAVQYDDLADKIRNLSEKQEDMQFSTAKLDDSLSNLPGPIGKVGQAMRLYGDTMQSAKGAMGALTKTFPILKNAIAATGIGALVIIIGLLVAAIMKAFNSFKPLQQATKQLGVAMKFLEDMIQPIIDLIGGALTWAIEGFSYAVAVLTGNVQKFNEEKAKIKSEGIGLSDSEIKDQEQQIDRLKKTIIDYRKWIKESNDKETIEIYQRAIARNEGEIDIRQKAIESEKGSLKQLLTDLQTYEDSFIIAGRLKTIDEETRAEEDRKRAAETRRNNTETSLKQLQSLQDEYALLGLDLQYKNVQESIILEKEQGLLKLKQLDRYH